MACKVEKITKRKTETTDNPIIEPAETPPDSINPNQNITVTDLTKKTNPVFNPSLVMGERALAVAKRLIVIQDTNIGPSLEERLIIKNSSLMPENMDSFRMASGFYWTIKDTNRLEYLENKSITLSYTISSFNFANDIDTLRDIKNGSIYNETSGSITDVGNDIFMTLQHIMLYNPEQIRPFPLNIKFQDYSFEMQIPFSNKELKNFNGLNKPLYADINPTYNFSDEGYENNLDKIPESILPNLYILMAELKAKEKKEDFENMISLNGLIDIKTFVPNISKDNSKDKKFIAEMLGEYFDTFAAKYNDLLVQKSNESQERIRLQLLNSVNNLAHSGSNIAIPITNINILKDLEHKKEMFPMYTDIEFSTDRTTQFSGILKDSQMSSLLMSRIIKNIENNNGFKEIGLREEKELIEEEKDTNGNIRIDRKANLSRNIRKTWDITEILKEFENEILKGNVGNERVGVFVDNDVSEKDFSNSTADNFVRALLKVIFVGKLRKLIKDKFRRYEDMLKGKMAYSETVMYRIEKFLADSGGNPIGQSIQSFYLPNSNDIDALDFIDTQVKYGVKYAYRVFAYQAVIGTEYQYLQPSRNFNSVWNNYVVVQRPLIKLVEIPYYGFVGGVMDDPPIPPEVDIIPFKGIDNRLRFNFNGGVGEYVMDPIYIESDDKAKFDSFRKIKNYDKDEMIRYKSDDFAGSFQIFRTDSWPKGYSDFNGKMIANVATDVNIASKQKASSATYDDAIVANHKYYYVFRTVDNHGHVSNPTDLFEVEMVNNSGIIFPVIRNVEFLKDDSKQKVKGFRKYLYIKPSLSQTIVNESKSGISDIETSVKDLQNVFLGVSENSIYGKQFLIRLRSKNSGKVINFRIDAEHQHVKKSDSKL